MNQLFLMLIICLSFLFGSVGRAQGLRLFEWAPGNTLAPLVLPVRQGELPEQAAQRYLLELSKNSDLMELFEGRLPDILPQGFSPIESTSRESRVLMMANLPKDYTLNSQRIINFKKIFAQKNHNSFILPINANLGLSRGETKELFNLISVHFPFLVAMGGDDVDPKFYNSENYHARNTISSRDQFEIDLIKSYVASDKGFILGVCRGLQITSVALGYKLVQDVPLQIESPLAHADNWHDVEILNNRNNFLTALRRWDSPHLRVYSYHHQSVIFKNSGPLELVAQSSDKVTEALAFRNGRGLLLQFHPEFMNDFLGSKILWEVLEYKNRVMPATCSKVFGG